MCFLRQQLMWDSCHHQMPALTPAHSQHPPAMTMPVKVQPHSMPYVPHMHMATQLCCLISMPTGDRHCLDAIRRNHGASETAGQPLLETAAWDTTFEQLLPCSRPEL